MFSLFAPRCPLETAEKAWVERRMSWLADRLGLERMLKAPAVVPTDDFFPDDYHADDASAQVCFKRVCGYIGVDPATLTLIIVPAENMLGIAGLYFKKEHPEFPTTRNRSHILISESNLEKPEQLVAVLAHEIAHEILLGNGHLTEDALDHEQVTDLLTVFLGFGVFNANVTLAESYWNYNNSYAWSIGKFGYLPASIFGYALAQFAHVRGETSPSWAYHLRPDAWGTFKAGLRYVRKTGDTLFHPNTAGRKWTIPTVDELIERLTHRNPSFRMGALWDVHDFAIFDPRLVPHIVHCLDDGDMAARQEAVRTFKPFGPHAAAAVPRLLEMVQGLDELWPDAIATLSALKAEPDRVIPEIVRLLRRPPVEFAMKVQSRQNSKTVLLVKALQAYGLEAVAIAIPALIEALGQAAATAGSVDEVLQAVHELVPDPQEAVRAHFSHDPELLRTVLWELKRLA